MRIPLRPVLLLGLACACQADDAAFTTSTSTPTSTSSPSSTATTDATTSSSASDSTSAATTTTTATPSTTSAPSTSDSTSTTLVLDVGSDKDLGDATPPGCKGKIDLLFVISRAGLMNEIQAQLIASFPKFIATIESKFETFDYHIMVVDTDKEWGLSYCTSDCPALACKIGEACCPYTYEPWNGMPCCPAADYPCGSLDLVGACDETIGAGNVFAAGYQASNSPCKIEGDRRYLSKGQTMLAETFACVAQVGTSGDNKVGDALTSALQPGINGPGGCNDGFLRDDALLMITVVTPGSDKNSAGDPASWYEAVVGAKNGDPSSVVMLSIGNPECPEFDEPCRLTEMFPYHVVGDGTAPNYGPAFESATKKIDAACQAFIPG